MGAQPLVLVPVVYCANCGTQLTLEEIAVWECGTCTVELPVPTPPPDLQQPHLVVLADDDEYNEVRVDFRTGCLAHQGGVCRMPYEPFEKERGLRMGCQVYQCACCKRYVPWCSGAAHGDPDLDELCDDCCVTHPKWLAQEAGFENQGV